MDRLEAVNIFVTVAEQGSFAGAARKLMRTPSAVARAVMELEEKLNTRLLSRTTRSVALTDAGGRYLERARELILASREFESAAPHDAEPSGILSICAPTNFGCEQLMPVLWDFLRRYPRVDARVHLSDQSVSLVDDGFDVALRYGRLPDSSLLATKLFETKRAVYASPAYIARHGVPSTPNELAHHHTISTSALNPLPERWSFGTSESVNQVAVKPRLILNTTEAAVDAAVNGFGLAYLMSYQVSKHLAAGALVEILEEYNTDKIPLHMVRPACRFTPPKVRVFVDEVGGALRSQSF